MGEKKRKETLSENVQEAISAAKAKEVIAAEQEKRVRACMAEVNAVLAKHGCVLQTAIIVAGGNLVSEVQVAPARGN